MTMQESEKVSVIIPYYNHPDYIVETLDSIKNDSYENKEIVLINDGSPCDGDRIIRKWIDENKEDIEIVYKYRENRGLTSTLNELISLSGGKYITMVGSDDFLLDGGIESRVEFLKKHPDLMAVFADSTLVDKNGKLLYESALFGFRGYPKDTFENPQMIKDTLLKRFVLAGPILMVKKEIYDVVGLYDESLLAEDLDFYLRALPKDLVGFLDEKVCAYRVHGENQSLEAITSKLLRDCQRAFLKNIHLYPVKYKPLMLWQVFKFFIKENLLKLGML